MADVGTADLVRRACRGDGAAYEELVRRHLRAAIAVALAIVGSVADAEDLAQEAFLIAFERIETLREPERFSGFLLQIVRNRARNALDHRRVRSDYAERARREGDAAAPVLPSPGAARVG